MINYTKENDVSFCIMFVPLMITILNLADKYIRYEMTECER